MRSNTDDVMACIHLKRPGVMSLSFDTFDVVGTMATRIVIVAVVSGVCSFFQVACLIRTSQRQGTAIRVAFFKSLLRQHIGYYDSIETGVVTSHLYDVALIQDAMGDKVGSYVQALSAFLASALQTPGHSTRGRSMRGRFTEGGSQLFFFMLTSVQY